MAQADRTSDSQRRQSRIAASRPLLADAAGVAPPSRPAPKRRPSAATRVKPAQRKRRAKPPAGPPRTVLGWLGEFLGSGLGAPLQLAMLGLTGIAVFVAVTLPDMPDVEHLRSVQFQEPLRVLSADGALIEEFGIQRRRPVEIAEIPPLVINAFLATEDSRFFEHRGVDAVGLGRALLSFVATGEKSQGGSTITMQVTRNFFLSPEKTFQRKLMEVLLTLHVEQTLSKEEILELYLNKIFFGHRAYGISAAAALYYDKALRDLTLPEVAMLAGIPKAPSANNPVTNPQRARERRDYVLGRMLELGYIDQAAHDAAVATADAAQLHRREPDLDAGYIAEMVRAEMVRFYGEDAITKGYRVTTTVDAKLQQQAQDAVREALRLYDRRHGYRGPEARLELAGMSTAAIDAYLAEVVEIPELVAGVVTAVSASRAEIRLAGGQSVTLDGKALYWAKNTHNAARWKGEKRRSSQAVQVGDLVRLTPLDGGGWAFSQIPEVGGALVALDPHDGAVRALVGGYAYRASKFNRAVDMRRQPGSSFKPFVFAAALENGWTPASLLRDETVKLTTNERWRPKNADHRELGPIRMRKALALSRNLAAINLLQSLGLEETRDYISRFGMDLDALPLGLSMALGTGELSPVKLAEGYAVFANGGYHVTPHFIQRIEDGDGSTIYEANPPRSCLDCWYRTDDGTGVRVQGTNPPILAKRVIDPRTAYQMTSMLRDVIEWGTGTRAKQLGRKDIVGKTGTTNDVRDSWFAGYQADLVTVAWMGFDDFGKLGRGEEGGRAALGMWVDFMGEALADRPEVTLEPPEGLVAVRVDPNRGVETKSRQGVAEMVQEEHRDNLLGPEPVRVVRSASASRSSRARNRSSSKPSRKPSAAARPAAPRVMDDLF